MSYKIYHIFTLGRWQSRWVNNSKGNEGKDLSFLPWKVYFHFGQWGFQWVAERKKYLL